MNVVLVVLIVLAIALLLRLQQRGRTGKHAMTSSPADFRPECDPLCPRPECYADLDCEPQGYCQAYFADDPTYGGRCVPA